MRALPADEFRFEFRLAPLERHEPWTPTRAVGWYELTSGEQIVALGGQSVLVAVHDGEPRWLD